MERRAFLINFAAEPKIIMMPQINPLLVSLSRRSLLLSVVVALILFCSCGGRKVELTESHPARFADTPWSNRTTAMQLDGRGYLWIGTDRGIQVYDGANYRLFLHDKDDTATIRSNAVVNFFKDRDNYMWVVTEDGIDRYEGNGVFRHFYHDAALSSPTCMTQTENGKIVALFGGDLCVLSGNVFKRNCRLSTSFFVDQRAVLYSLDNGRLLANTSAGIFLIDTRHSLFRSSRVVLSGVNVTCADKDNIYILNFITGIYCYDRKTLRLKYHSGQAMPVVPEEAVAWRGNLYFSGHDGIYVVDGRDHAISRLPENVQKALSPDFISRFYVTPNNMLFIGYSSRFALRKLRSIEDFQQQLRTDGLYNIFHHHGVTSVTQDGQGNIFGALDNDSIFLMAKNGKNIQMASLNDFIPIHSRQHVNGVYYSAGYFWVVTTSSVFALKCDGGIQFAQLYDIGLVHSCPSGSAVPYRNGLVVIADKAMAVIDAVHKTSYMNGIRLAANHLPVIFRKGDFSVRTIKIDNSKIPMGAALVNLGNNKILAVHHAGGPWVVDISSGQTRKSSLRLPGAVISMSRHGSHTFIGTDNGLCIYDSESGFLTNIAERYRKPVNNVMATNRGLLATCEGDIVFFDPATRRLDTIWHGSPAMDFQPHTLVWPGGSHLFAATLQGFRSYAIRSRQRQEVRPQLFIESVEVVMSNDTHRCCSLYDADSTATVILGHNENTFKITFSAISPNLSEKYTYSYRLKGYDNSWRYLDASGQAEYTKVKPGHYRFEIRCTDQQRPWITVSKSLLITVKPHPLLSWAAISFYALLVLVAIYFINRLYIRMRMMRMNSNNAAFFYNISHEFRNPITMIAGPVSMLRKAPELSKQSANMVRLISQSARILSKLVSQMLDFNLLEGEAMRLSVSKMDVAAIISEYSHHYEVSASEKGIKIINRGLDSPVVMFADEDKVIKVFDNFMSNAIKHTPQGGTITVALEVKGSRLELSVANTGPHIPVHSLGHIFERYYQAPSDVANWGVGLGLSYVKSLVTMHHGSVVAANTAGGVIFTVSLPMSDTAYSSEDRKPREEQRHEEVFKDDDVLRPRQLQPLLGDVDSKTGPQTMAEGGKSRRLLIIEKDVNTAYFLRKIFEGDYLVTNRYDAEAAFSDMGDIRPDVIISCVRLTGKSGLDLCRELRASEQWKNIPFIFLSTCNSGEEQAEGMRAGADAYVTKPFDPDYLREVVSRTLKHAQDYEAVVSQLPQAQKEDSGEELSTRDKEMLRIMRKFMKDNISDGDLDVEKLCRKLLLSRTKLYEKVKALTGKTPNELFRTYKLNYAAQLLKEGKLNVSEVAEKAGFSSVAFFSRTFKKYYGVSPKDYD